MAHHFIDLIALQMADEVQRRAVIGVLRQFGRHLLHPVFPQRVDAGGNGLPAGGGVVHLAGAYQNDVRRIPARFPGRCCDIGPHPGDIFCDGHEISLFLAQFFLYS